MCRGVLAHNKRTVVTCVDIVTEQNPAASRQHPYTCRAGTGAPTRKLEHWPREVAEARFSMSLLGLIDSLCFHALGVLSERYGRTFTGKGSHASASREMKEENPNTIKVGSGVSKT